MTRPTVYYPPPLHLAKGSTSYVTIEFENYLCRHEVDLSERQAYRAALHAMKTEKPAYWSVLELHTLGGQTYKVCAERDGITVGAAQKRHQRALKHLAAAAVQIKPERAST